MRGTGQISTPRLDTFPDHPGYRQPNEYDVQYHYRSADWWLRVASMPDRPDSWTSGAAAIAQAHAALGLLAHHIALAAAERNKGTP